VSWRSVLISKPGRLSYSQNRLVIEQGNAPVSVPLEDIAVIVLDCRELQLSAPLLSECAAVGVSIIVIDESHMPSGVLLPLLTHSRAFGVMRAQMAISKPLKKRLWQVIVQQKIRNQAACISGDVPLRQLARIANQVKSGDPDNREAAAAGVYFKALFGESYLRREPTLLTGAQNFGYAILRSAIGRALVMHGLMPALGLHHDNERNAFNLADDLIEPFRPLVDREVSSWSESHGYTADEERLTPKLKQLLVGILHKDCADTASAEDRRSVLNQIDQTVVSLVRAIKARDPRCLVLPVLDES